MPVSERDRDHFRKIADGKAQVARERAEEALSEPQMKRMLDGLAMGAASRTDAAIEEMLDRRAEGQAELSRRARRLGLLRPVR
jgi:hypothetical protein